MAITNEQLFKAILAMDAYNRGSGRKIVLDDDILDGGLGND